MTGFSWLAYNTFLKSSRGQAAESSVCKHQKPLRQQSLVPISAMHGSFHKWEPICGG